MNKRATSVARSSSTETYRQRLIEKRDQVVSGLGVKFDTIAKMGRIAEEDQAQLSHDEFVMRELRLITSRLAAARYETFAALTCASTMRTTSDLPTAPTRCSTTFPSLNSSKVGMPRML